MIFVSEMVDLDDRSWGPKEARAMIERTGHPLIALEVLAQGHDHFHRFTDRAARRAWWRPWRRRRILGERREGCEEFHRRMNLIAEVANAMAQERKE